MKKSKLINLVLITAALSSCHKAHKAEWKNGNVYMRGDTSAVYEKTQAYYNSNGNFWLWYYAFRPYGYYSGGQYYSTGYYSSSLSERSNIGSNSTKSGVVRGGFGGGFSVSSSS